VFVHLFAGNLIY